MKAIRLEMFLGVHQAMIQRQCPECDGELVLARRPDNQGSGIETRPSTYLRCSTCGGEFTAEQVRENKRTKQLDSATAQA